MSETHTTDKIPGPPEGICKFYVEKKRRYCKFPPSKNEEFCIQHLPRNSAGEFELGGKKRIPCPLDPNHTIYESKLDWHLKKCSMNQRKHQGAYFQLNVNSGAEEVYTEPKPVLLANVEIKKIKDLVDKVCRIYDEYVKLTERIEEHEALKADLYNPEHQKCLKHRKQEASLIGNIAKSGWLDTDGTIYIEFGAGRARLTTYLLDIISTHSKSKVLLVDRDASRHKCENRYKYLENGPALERLRIDIKDLALEKHGIGEGRAEPVIAYSKHLCGAATDLTLRCISRLASCVKSHTEENYSDSNDAPDNKKIKLTLTSSVSGGDSTTEIGVSLSRGRVKGIQIALCCHQRCLWLPYVGKQFWLSNDLTAEDFILTRTLSSWATCAFPDRDQSDGDGHQCTPLIDKENRFAFWSNEQREQIGLRCKRVIDIGREKYLQSLGFDTSLVEYVKRDISLENVMLCAYPKSA